MGERIRPSRSGLIAIEITVAVGVFALCAAISIGLLVRAELLSRDSAELTQAVSQARNAAECYKSTGGNLDETARLLGGEAGEAGARLCYDGDWTLQPKAETAAHVLELIPLDPPEAEGLQEAELTVTGREGEVLLSWTVAAWEGSR